MTAFNFTRRGLFEKHKIIVTTMLCLRIMLRSKKLAIEEVNHLILGKVDALVSGVPDNIKSFITESIWGGCRVIFLIIIFIIKLILI